MKKTQKKKTDHGAFRLCQVYRKQQNQNQITD